MSQNGWAHFKNLAANGISEVSLAILGHYTLKSYKNSRSEVFCKKGVLKNFAKLTGKHRCQSLFFNKVFNKFPWSYWS